MLGYNPFHNSGAKVRIRPFLVSLLLFEALQALP